MGGAGGGAWKVAYADFVTAMMAFFMVMWLTSQKQDVKQAVAGYFRDPFAIHHGNETGGAEEVSQRRREKREKETPQDAHVRSLAPSGRDVDSRFTVKFPGDQADLDEAALQSLREIAPALVGKLNRIEIRGHCLRQPLDDASPFADRWELCYARTQAVRAELEDLGVEPQRIRMSQSEGNEPLSTSLDQDEIALNSRVDVIVLSDYAEIPWQKDQLGGESGSAGHAAGEDHAAPPHESSHDSPAGDHAASPPDDHGGH